MVFSAVLARWKIERFIQRGPPAKVECNSREYGASWQKGGNVSPNYYRQFQDHPGLGWTGVKWLIKLALTPKKHEMIT